MKALRSLVLNLLLLTFVSGVCLILLELVVRLTPLSERLGGTQILSLTDRFEAAPPKAPGELRMLAVGDSFGAYYELQSKNFFRVAESLAREAGHPVLLFNASEGGGGIDGYRGAVEFLSLPLAADILLIAIYTGNDLLDYELYHKAEVLREQAPRIEPAVSGSEAPGPGLFSRLKRMVKRNSLVLNISYRLLKQKIKALRSGSYDRSVEFLKRIDRRDDRYVREMESGVDAELLEQARSDQINPWDAAFGVMRPNLYSEMLSLKEGTAYPEAYSRFSSDVGGLISMVRAQNKLVLFIVIPPSVQVSERYHQYFTRLGYNLSASEVGSVALHERLLALFQAEKVPYVDLLPVLQSSTEPVYLENDIHLNLLGHRLAGEALFTALEKQGLLSSRPRPVP